MEYYLMYGLVGTAIIILIIAAAFGGKKPITVDRLIAFLHKKGSKCTFAGSNLHIFSLIVSSKKQGFTLLVNMIDGDHPTITVKSHANTEHDVMLSKEETGKLLPVLMPIAKKAHDTQRFHHSMRRMESKVREQ